MSDDRQTCADQILKAIDYGKLPADETEARLRQMIRDELAALYVWRSPGLEHGRRCDEGPDRKGLCPAQKAETADDAGQDLPDDGRGPPRRADGRGHDPAAALVHGQIHRG